MTLLLPVLYHWSPAERHKEIRTMGLRPYSEPTVSSGVPESEGGDHAMPYVCYGFTPSGAWSMSGGFDYVSEIEDWDLWQVTVDDGDEVHIRPEFGYKMQEVKIYTPIPADRVWFVGRRTLPAGEPVKEK